MGKVTRHKLTPDIKTAFDSPGTSSRSVPPPPPRGPAEKEEGTPPRSRGDSTNPSDGSTKPQP